MVRHEGRENRREPTGQKQFVFEGESCYNVMTSPGRETVRMTAFCCGTVLFAGQRDGRREDLKKGGRDDGIIHWLWHSADYTIPQ